MNILADSDILIEVSRGRNQAVLTRWRELEQSDDVVLYSAASAAEFWAGVKPGEYEATVRLFQALECVPVDYEMGTQAGHYLRRYGKSHNLELGDALIAAAAVLRGAALWTRNRKHFPMRELSFF